MIATTVQRTLIRVSRTLTMMSRFSGIIIIVIITALSPCSIGDMCDKDMDGDGAPNEEDNCPTKPNPDQVDTDDDGYGDSCDNCPRDKNPDQTDENQNFIGDICEQGEDEDGDGFVGKS